MKLFYICHIVAFGLLSNYKQIVSSLTSNRKYVHAFGTEFFKRPQLDALSSAHLNPLMEVSSFFKPRRRRIIARVPSIL